MKKSKIDDFFKNIKKNICFYIGLFAFLVSILLTVLIYRPVIFRLFSAIKDFVTSIGYYFCFMFDAEDLISPTVEEFPDLDIWQFLPWTLEEILFKLENFWSAFFSLENFLNFLIDSILMLNYTVIILTALVPSVGGIVYVFFSSFSKDHIEPPVQLLPSKSKFRILRFVRKIRIKLRAFRMKLKSILDFAFSKFDVFFRRALRKVKAFIKYCVGYYTDHRGFVNAVGFIWLVNTNIFAIILEAFAYYFYLITSFDLSSVIIIIGKLIFDIIIMLWTLPLFLWFVVAYVAFSIIRRKLAYKELQHLEAKTRGFIKSLPIVIMITGTMGKGKTKTAVDMALSKEHEFRDKALELMDRNIMRFPNFDFSAFENTLKEQIKSKEIKNLASARSFVWRCRFDYGRHPDQEKIWGYDVSVYDKTYNDGLKIIDIWDMLEWYAQEYFVYTMSTSLIISNLAVRSDLDPDDEGFFVLYNKNFFKRDPEKLEEYSVYSHIIDFDLFRVGVQMCRNKDIAGSFEFGVILVTEIGKERGNNLENKEEKKSAEEANRKNDKFNEWLKMCRHAATIEGFAFICFICDEQRASSWGADARDLCTIVNIEENLEHRTTLILCILPEIFMSRILRRYFSWLDQVHNKGNLKLPPVQGVNSIVAAYWQHCERTLNTFGYNVERVGIESGTLEDKTVKLHDYYILDKKIYSRRYATDCFKDGFANKALKAGTSLYEIDTYKTECALLEELARQRSYFANTFVQMYKETW